MGRRGDDSITPDTRPTLVEVREDLMGISVPHVPETPNMVLEREDFGAKTKHSSQYTQAPIIFFLCLSAHSLLAILPRSAASARARLAASSFSFLSRSRASFSMRSRLKTSLPFSFCCAASTGVTTALGTMTLLRFAEDVDVERD